MAQRRRTRMGKTGCLFWLFILLVIIVIFVYKGRGNLKEAFKFVKNNPITEAFKKTEETETTDKAEITQAEEPEAEAAFEEDTAAKPDRNEERSKAEAPNSAGENVVKTGKSEPEKKPSKIKKTGADKDQPRSPTKNDIKTKEYKAVLYFVKINEEDGTAKPAPVHRTVKFKDSPITRTIEALMNGPTENEKRKGMTSFIPDDTELISASIQNGHLTLNFDNKFEENYSGIEAIRLELYQVLLTSFDISQVTKLSILIEGNSKRYITGDGIPIKEVYTKQDISELMLDN